MRVFPCQLPHDKAAPRSRERAGSSPSQPVPVDSPSPRGCEDPGIRAERCHLSGERFRAKSENSRVKEKGRCKQPRSLFCMNSKTWQEKLGEPRAERWKSERVKRRFSLHFRLLLLFKGAMGSVGEKEKTGYTGEDQGHRGPWRGGAPGL